jgi:hypothetical protein
MALPDTIAAALADRPPRLERELYGTVDPARIAAALDRFCARHLGAAVASGELYAASVGSVCGVTLRDGRRVVVKVHRAGEDRAHLSAVQAVQAHLSDTGFPAPRPLLRPTPLGRGVAVAETLLDDGRWADAHAPAVRAQVAAGLARLVSLTGGLTGLPGLRSEREGAARLWRDPHDLRFDFAATARGAEWIDRLAGAARRELDERAAGTLVVGHADWRVEHLRLRDGDVSAVYDCDSFAVAPEPVFAGLAAHGFCADWTVEGLACVPTLDESMAFLHDYERARGEPFTAPERRTAHVALVAVRAYSARCEHSDVLTGMGAHAPAPAGPEVAPGGYLAFLARHGPALLGVRTDGVPPVRSG